MRRKGHTHRERLVKEMDRWAFERTSFFFVRALRRIALVICFRFCLDFSVRRHFSSDRVSETVSFSETRKRRRCSHFTCLRQKRKGTLYQLPNSDSKIGTPPRARGRSETNFSSLGTVPINMLFEPWWDSHFMPSLYHVYWLRIGVLSLNSIIHLFKTNRVLNSNTGSEQETTSNIRSRVNRQTVLSAPYLCVAEAETLCGDIKDVLHKSSAELPKRVTEEHNIRHFGFLVSEQTVLHQSLDDKPA